MCIVSGPYTADADLSYKPWRALLNVIKTTKPTVILLVTILYHHIDSRFSHISPDWTIR
jgi:DNA polymerase alpha subunit B